MSSHCADHIRVEHGRISSGRHRRDDIPGADRIAADAGLLETERSVLGHTDHGSLGSDISGPTAAFYACYGSDVDDRSARLHSSGSSTHTAHGSFLVRLNNAVEIFIQKAVDWF